MAASFTAVNLTPHAIHYVSADDPALSDVYQPSGEVARVKEREFVHQLLYSTRLKYDVAADPSPGGSTALRSRGCLVWTLEPYPSYGPVEGLPEPQEGVFYIVSGLVLQHCAGRADVVAPATGPTHEAIRDEKGRIKAVTRFLRAPGV